MRLSNNRIKNYWSKIDTKGFTLIELIIVVLILAVLSIFAIPNYQKYLIEARMKEAVLVMLKDALFMKKFYTLNGRFTSKNQWPQLPYSVSPESGTILYRITLTPSVYSIENDNEYRFQAQPICGTIVADSGCVCIDQDNNVYLHQTKLCLNSPTDCRCLAPTVH